MNKINLLTGIAGFILFLILLTMGIYLNALGIFLIASGFVVASENPFSGNPVKQEKISRKRIIFANFLKISGVAVILYVLFERMFL